MDDCPALIGPCRRSGTYATLGGVMVARLWTASDRREERLVLLDRAKIDEVERRQRGLRAARPTV